MNEETVYPYVDRYRLSRMSHISWEDLASVLFGLKPSEIESFDMPEEEKAEVYSMQASLLNWIRSDVYASKLKCSDDIDQENPTFKTRDIGSWLQRDNFHKWFRARGFKPAPSTQNFLFRVATGYDYEDLRLDEKGGLDIKYYGSLKSWPWADATRILYFFNPDKKREIELSLRASKADNDPLFAEGFLVPKPDDKVKRVRPVDILVWAGEKGFYFPEELLVNAGRSVLDDPDQKKSYDEAIMAAREQVSSKEPEPTPTPTPKPEQASATVKAMFSGVDAKILIGGLKVWAENPVEIIIRQPGKNSVIYTPSNLGFSNPNTKEWKSLLDILKTGHFIFHANDRASKEMFKRLEKKLVTFFKRQFHLIIRDDFKIFELSSGRKGIRTPIFQIPAMNVEEEFDYSSLDKEKTEEMLRILSRSSDINTAGSLNAVTEHAKSLGMTDSDIDRIIDVEREFLHRDVVDPYENT